VSGGVSSCVVHVLVGTSRSEKYAYEGQAKVSNSTVLISAFYINQIIITASGYVVLSFADTDGARQLGQLKPMRNYRLLQADEQVG